MPRMRERRPPPHSSYGVDEHLDVGPRAEAVAARLEVLLDLGKVVDLAVGDDLHRAVLVRRTAAAPPAMSTIERRRIAEADARQQHAALLVRPTMVQRPDHPLDVHRGNRATQITLDDADDPTHSEVSPPRPLPAKPDDRAAPAPARRRRRGTPATSEVTTAPAPIDGVAADAHAVGDDDVRAEPDVIADVDAASGPALLQDWKVDAIVEVIAADEVGVRRDKHLAADCARRPPEDLDVEADVRLFVELDVAVLAAQDRVPPEEDAVPGRCPVSCPSRRDSTGRRRRRCRRSDLVRMAQHDVRAERDVAADLAENER